MKSLITFVVLAFCLVVGVGQAAEKDLGLVGKLPAGWKFEPLPVPESNLITVETSKRNRLEDRTAKELAAGVRSINHRIKWSVYDCVTTTIMVASGNWQNQLSQFAPAFGHMVFLEDGRDTLSTTSSTKCRVQPSGKTGPSLEASLVTSTNTKTGATLRHLVTMEDSDGHGRLKVTRRIAHDQVVIRQKDGQMIYFNDIIWVDFF